MIVTGERTRLETALAYTPDAVGWAAAVTRQEAGRRRMAKRVAQVKAWRGLRG